MELTSSNTTYHVLKLHGTLIGGRLNIYIYIYKDVVLPVKIRRSRDRLIFNMGIPITGTGSWTLITLGSQRSDFWNNFHRHLSIASKGIPHRFVMGDISLDINFANSLCDVSMVFNFTNLVNGPTCFKGGTPSSVNVLLSSEPRCFKSALNAQCSLSDFHN